MWSSIQDLTGQSVRRMTMVTRVLSITAAVVSLATAAAAAGTLTDRLQTARMTVLRVGKGADQFMCAEPRRWTSGSGSDLSAARAGHNVRLAALRGLTAG